MFLLIGGMAAWYHFSGYREEIQALKTEADLYVKNADLSTFDQNQTSMVYDANGSVISMLKGEKESYYLPLEEMPVDVPLAIVSIEDKKFFQHDGVDYRAIVRAVKAMIENGEPTQGGSTITMQLARNMFLTQEKTWQRKIEEMFIAWGLEKKFTKNQILEFYLNNIYFGGGYYGIQSASRGYFGCDVQQLSLSQIAFLCAIPNNPTLYNPFENMDKAVLRRDRILRNMLEDGKIAQSVYEQALTEQIILNPPQALSKNDYVETFAYYCATRALMELEHFQFCSTFESEEQKDAYEQSYHESYAACQKKLYTGGYHIYTSLDLALQDELQSAVNDTLSEFTEVNEEGIYTLQASAVCIDNTTGYVRAIVGGRKQDYPGYTLNRAYQSFRQPGSAIKPLTVYTPSFEAGYTLESPVVDEPIEDGPRNANGAYMGEITIRTAIEKSVNTIAWKLYDELTPQKGLSYLQEMNFSKLDREDYRLATSLGGFTRGVSALEMTSGYAAIQNDGKFRQPTCIVEITGRTGEKIYVQPQTEKAVYSQNAARTMTEALVGVMTDGTGKGLKLKGIPCAGKTGTTNDQKDGWFVGYTRYYTTGVWVGYDMPQKLTGLAGSTYPGKIWQTFMEEIHQNLPPMEFLPSAKLSEGYQEETEQQEEGSLWNIDKNVANGKESEHQPENPQPSENTGQPENTGNSQQPSGNTGQPENTGNSQQPSESQGQPPQTPGPSENPQQPSGDLDTSEQPGNPQPPQQVFPPPSEKPEEEIEDIPSMET